MNKMDKVAVTISARCHLWHCNKKEIILSPACFSPVDEVMSFCNQGCIITLCMRNISLVLSCVKPSQNLEELVLFAWFNYNTHCMSCTETHEWLLQSRFHQTVQFSPIHYTSELGCFFLFVFFCKSLLNSCGWYQKELSCAILFFSLLFLRSTGTQHTDPILKRKMCLSLHTAQV